MARTVKVLTSAQIVDYNRLMIQSSGGDFIEPSNVFHEGRLESVIIDVEAEYFGVIRYPTAIEKSAALGWKIIEGHVFRDGNKRTGMLTCEANLNINGYELPVEDNEIITVALNIACGELSIEDFIEWVRTRAVRNPRRRRKPHS